LAAALDYLARGWQPLPIVPGEKRPLVDWKEFQYRLPTADEVRGWWDRWPDAGVGLVTGALSGFVVIDIDSDEAEQAFKELVGDVVTLTGVTARGRHRVFKHPGFAVGNHVGILGAMDVRGDGGLVVAAPTVHETGVRYHWDDEHGMGLDCPIAELPEALLALLQQPKGERVEDVEADQVEEADAKAVEERFVLPAIIGEGERDDVLFRYACSLRSRGLDRDAILSKLTTVNTERCRPPLPPSVVEAKAESAAGYPAGDPQSLHYSDLGNAQRLVRQHGHRLRFVNGRGWFVWNGCHWALDRTGEVMRLAKAVVRQMHVEAANIDDDRARQALARWALQSESTQRLRAMVQLAETEPEVSIAPDVLDRDPWLLNVLNGTLDLRNGTLGPHDPADLMTRVAPVDFDPEAQAPLWLAFLDRVLGGDPELVSYLQRCVGYSLTGKTTEQVLLFLFGHGANGKSCFVNAILDLMGPYAEQADPLLLLARNGETHPTGMADLAGSRMVVCSEVDEGRHLAEATLKLLTGGDRVKARLLYKDFFEFQPTHSLWMVANHRPVVKGTDYGIWRRIKLIPFEVTIPEHERDGDLPEKLRAELPGILAWAVRGCLEWQQRGLDDPAAVRNASAQYKADMDLLAQFLEECCDVDATHGSDAKDVYGRYVEWCKASGLTPMAKQSFGRRMGERGLGSVRGAGNKAVYASVAVRM
jgi:putative DNA primase/helicase